MQGVPFIVYKTYIHIENNMNTLNKIDEFKIHKRQNFRWYVGHFDEKSNEKKSKKTFL